MTEQDSPLRKFNEHVDEYLWIQLKCCEEEIANLSSSKSIEDITDLLIKTNALIDQFFGDDEVMYENYRYRMFVFPEAKKVVIVQGSEIDVDVRSWGEIYGLNQSGDDLDEEIFDDDEFDDEDFDDEDF